MIFRLRIAFAVLWLSCTGAVSAQIGFSMPFINAAVPGTDKYMTVKVTNFDSIVSMQYVIRWDPTVLQYVTINTFGAIPGLDLLDFNVQQAVDSGIVRLVWEGPNSFPGVSVIDGYTIFRLRFTVIGSDTSSTPVKFTETNNTFPALDFEIVKVVSPDSTLQAFDEQDCTLINGFVAVGYTVATDEPASANVLELIVSPNPFSDNTKAEFHLAETADVQAFITDAAGRLVFQKDMPHLPSGKHAINIDKAVFQAKGAYFITIRAGSQTSVQPMICN
jgi:hypothetical protein